MHIDLNPVALDSLIRVTAVLALGFSLQLALFRGAAAVCHRVCLLTLLCAMAMPALFAVTPGWHVLPSPDAARSGGMGLRLEAQRPEAVAPLPMADEIPQRAPIVSASWLEIHKLAATPRPARGRLSQSWQSSVRRITWTVLLTSIWLCGCTLLIARLLAAWLALSRITRRSDRCSDNVLTSLLLQARRELNVERTVELRLSADCSMPMTWGVFRPTIILPQEAIDWPRSRLRPVLLHELAHVKRADALAQIVARIACAIYWFHPLAWLIAARMTRQQERAADDMVLASHEPPIDYARLLLELAAQCPSRHAAGAIAMARPVALESRLRSLLDPARKRGGMSRGQTFAAALIAFSIIAPLAALRSRAQIPEAPATAPASSMVSYTGHVLSPEGQPLANVEIVMQREGRGETARTRSAADGGFALSGPPPKSRWLETVTVAARAAGQGYGSARLIAGIDNFIHILPSTNVKVTFVDPEGKPVAGMHVWPTFTSSNRAMTLSESPGYLGAVYHSRHWTDEQPLITDANGVCEFTMLPRLSNTQIEVGIELYAQPSNKQRVQTSAGPQSPPVTIQLKRAGRITGKVIRAATGEPVPGIHLIAISRDSSGAVTHGGYKEIASNDRGEFRIDQVEPGKYMMRLNEQQDIGWTAAFRQEVIVEEGKTTADQDFRLLRGTVVSGRLMEGDSGRGVAEAIISAVEPATRQYPGSSETDAQGRYSLRVPPGLMQLYMATIPPEGYSNAAFDARTNHQLGFHAVDGVDVTIDLKLTPKPGNPLAGRVIGPDGNPAAGAKVKLQNEQEDAGILDSTTLVQADEHGEFHFRAILPGSKLSATLGAMGTIEPLEVNGGEQNVMLKLAADVRTTLVGRAVDDAGKPIEDARVSLGFRSGNSRYMIGPGGTPATLTDSQGRFTIKYLTPGSTYVVQIDADGYIAAKPNLSYKPGEPTCDMGDIRMNRR